MNTVSKISDLRSTVAAARRDGKRIGFVPTMGALHEGHLSLVDVAKNDSEFVVMSIFVNPAQFGPSEDYSKYPRNLVADSGMAGERGVDLIFAPDVSEMYPDKDAVTVAPNSIASRWEGAIRPGHFAGVLTIVSKLFNIVQPDSAVFGQKDLQQVALVGAMVRELNFPIEISVAPTVREPDGLAMSSRNVYLSKDDRSRAVLLSRALNAVREGFSAGETSVRTLEASGRGILEGDSGVKIDYFAVVDANSMHPIEVAAAGNAVIVAARIGETRLIDNIIL